MARSRLDLTPLSPDESVYAAVSNVVARLQPPTERRVVVDAGCGSATHLRLQSDARVIGVDISEQQLARHEHIDDRVCADLQAVDLSHIGADIVVCWNVLEHLADPRRAVANLCGALKPGGTLVLAAPNPRAVKGLITKLTPYRLHVWYYRFILRRRDAGTDDKGPFPTPMRFALAPERVVGTCRQHGVDWVCGWEYEGSTQQALRRRLGILAAPYVLAGRALEFLSAKRVPFKATEYALVLRRDRE